MKTELKGTDKAYRFEEYQFSVDSDVLESFEIVLIEMQYRGLAHVGTPIDRSDGHTELRVLLYRDGE